MPVQNRNINQLIFDRYASFSARQKQVADYVMANINEVIYFPLSKLVSAIGASQATIVRFAQALGYQGFNEFRHALFEYYRDYLSPDGRMKHSIEVLEQDSLSYEQLSRKEILYLERSISTVDNSVFKDSIEAISDAESIYIFGIGPDEPLACHLHFRLRRLKLHCHQVSVSGRDLFEHLLVLSSRDLAVVYSFSKPSIDFKRLTGVLADRHVPVILITDIKNPALTRIADHILYAERGPAGTFPSPLVPMAITNALILGVAEELENKAVDALKELGDLRDRFFYSEKYK
ncbi:MAG: MurR/RpiR family transcriptional regulator [Spirochaetaceae bacterium]|nr:MAG: MurR/RpiR family transcriptional regulator [Spirochaetaceae bacterium]